MFCSMSGSVPEEPVVDRNTGHLFEKRLVQKYIQETGQSPITGETLSIDDLLPIKSDQAVKPRPSPATSIPGLLSLFQNEWDALMLETHSLRQSLGTTRQELSQALYQHDASVRVIARLQRERDEARAALEQLQLAGPKEALNGKRAGPEDAASAPAKRAKGGITADIVEALTENNVTLSKMRRKRQISETLATPDDVTRLDLAGNFPIHKTTQGGILALDLELGKENIVYTAGVDHTGQVFDTRDKRVVASLTGHSKKLTDIKAMGKQELVLTASADKTARLWKTLEDGKYTCTAVLKDHSSDVTGVTPHVTSDYFVTASLDKTWCFYDTSTATCLQQVSEDSIQSGYSSVQFHPDGLILGTGTQDSTVRVWEVRQQKVVATLNHAKGAAHSISFSENGFYLATTADDGVKVWDLRKLLNIKTFTPSGATNFASFDHSGNYLAVGGSALEVYGVKQDWQVVKTFSDLPKKAINSGKWGVDAKTLVVGAGDHNLRLFTLVDEDVAME